MSKGHDQRTPPPKQHFGHWRGSIDGQQRKRLHISEIPARHESCMLPNHRESAMRKSPRKAPGWGALGHSAQFLRGVVNDWVDAHPGIEGSVPSDIYGLDPTLAGIAAEELAVVWDFFAELEDAITTQNIALAVKMLNNILKSLDYLSIVIKPGDWDSISKSVMRLRVLDSLLPLSATTLYVPHTIRHRRNILVRASQHDPNSMYRVTSREFEEIIATIFQTQGFDVQLTPQSRDHGRDIILEQQIAGVRSRWLVECKRWARNRKVGLPIVQRLFGVVQSEQANKAILVSTSGFTGEARKFAQRHAWALDLRSYDDIIAWLNLAVPKLQTA
jgi:HJR/Mrr/RecB family endonuclease